MTEYVLSPPDQIVQHMATGIVDSIRRDPKLRESLREILLTGESDAWVGQRGSPLGPRRHRAAVERHVAAGEPRARIAGRRYELRRDLLDEVLLERGRVQVARAAERETAADGLAAELGLEVVG